MADPTADQVVIWWKELKQLLQTRKPGFVLKLEEPATEQNPLFLDFPELFMHGVWDDQKDHRNLGHLKM